MAQVPYNPVPEVAPTEQGTPRLRVDTPLAAFGGSVAAATSNLGSQLEKSGNEIFTRAIAMQQLHNEAIGHNITIAGAEKLGQARSAYLQTSGDQAKDALPKYQADIQDVRKEAIGSAPNPMVARMVDNEISSRVSRDLDYAGLHAATEMKKFTTQSSQGVIDLHIQGAASKPEDDAAWDDHVKAITEKTNEKAYQLGQPEAERVATLNKNLATAATKRAESMALTKPFDAMRLYQANPAIYGGNQVQVQKFIQSQVTSNGSKQLVDGVVNSNGYNQKLATKESGGDITAKAATSSAEGLYQFTTGTWASVRSAHPELNLPTTVGAADKAQQTAAVNAFTLDNSKILTGSNVPTTQANLYLAHFLGAGGAVKFYNGMKADPTATATSLVTPATAMANHSIFYRFDGSPRTAAEAYMKLTSTFGGPGPLTRDSDSTWLTQAQKTVADAAEPFSDFAPGLKAATLSRLDTAYSQVHMATVQADQGSYLRLSQAIGGAGQPNSLTDVSQLMRDPVAADVYTHLPQAYQQRLQSQLKANAKFSPNATPERDQNYQKIMNMSVELSGKRSEFQAIDPYQLVNDGQITRPQADQIYNKQRQIMQGQANDSRHMSHAIGVSRDYLKAANIVSGSDQDLQFKGAMNTWLTDYEQEKKHFPSDEEVRTKAKDLISSAGGYNIPVIGNVFGRFSFEPPSEFVKESTPLFKRYSNGKEPSAEDLARMYQHSLTHPNWKDEFK